MGDKIVKGWLSSWAYHLCFSPLTGRKRDSCAEGTRTLFIHQILAWIDDPDPSSRMIWIYADAAAGKSAIAGSIVETLCGRRNVGVKDLNQEEYHLLAWHFFPQRTSATVPEQPLPLSQTSAPNDYDGVRLFPSLSQQIVSSFTRGQHINRTIGNDPSIFLESQSVLFRNLVLDPLQALTKIRSLSSIKATLVIDGIDACTDIGIQREIILALATCIPSIPVTMRIIVLSRPEHHITKLFSSLEPDISTSYLSSIRLEDLWLDTKEIKHILSEGFHKIRKDNPHLPPEWPSEESIEAIANISPHHPMFAKSALSYIEYLNDGHHIERLNVVLGAASTFEYDPSIPFRIFNNYVFQSMDADLLFTISPIISLVHLSEIESRGSDPDRFIPTDFRYSTLDKILDFPEGRSKKALESTAPWTLSILPSTDVEGIRLHPEVALSFLLWNKSRLGEPTFDEYFEPTLELVRRYHWQELGLPA